MKIIKYILWDNDGVLVETENWYAKANQKALNEIGLETSTEQYIKCMQTGGSCFDIAFDAGYSKEEIRKIKNNRNDYYEEFLINNNVEIQNTEETLEILSKKYKMAIVTSSKKRFFDVCHKKGNLTKYMEFIMTREDFIKGKPNPESYLKALKRFNAKPEDAIVIEDSERGMKAAIAAGMKCIVVKNHMTKSHDFTGAYKIVDSIKNLTDLL